MRGQTFSSDSDDRWKSLMTVAKELGIEVQPELVVQLEQNLSSPELGYPVVPQLLASKRPFTAPSVAAVVAVHELWTNVFPCLRTPATNRSFDP